MVPPVARELVHTPPLTVAQRLRQALTERGLSVRGFAKMLAGGESATQEEIAAAKRSVNKWLSGTLPRPENAERIAALLKLPAHTFKTQPVTVDSGPSVNDRAIGEFVAMIEEALDRQEQLQADQARLAEEQKQNAAQQALLAQEQKESTARQEVLAERLETLLAARRKPKGA